MEFKDKLQQLRTSLKLSQEDLASQLQISRQSVTKWENGQSFPDIQNLITLSDIFKVSIDRLIKNDDACNIQLSKSIHTFQDIRLFLQKAKINTYVIGEHKVASSKVSSHDYRYTDGD